MIVHLFNGSKTKDAWDPQSPEFIDGWKPEYHDFECEGAQLTYNTHLKVYPKDAPAIFLDFDGEYIVHNGVFYGDCEFRP